jgi:hypothetical protein
MTVTARDQGANPQRRGDCQGRVGRVNAWVGRDSHGEQGRGLRAEQRGCSFRAGG